MTGELRQVLRTMWGNGWTGDAGGTGWTTSVSLNSSWVVLWDRGSATSSSKPSFWARWVFSWESDFTFLIQSHYIWVLSGLATLRDSDVNHSQIAVNYWIVGILPLFNFLAVWFLCAQPKSVLCERGPSLRNALSICLYGEEIQIQWLLRV